jgi:hypothetical protein
MDTSELRERVDSVLQSDVSLEPPLCDASIANGFQIGVDTLLNRLKQSIAAARVRTASSRYDIRTDNRLGLLLFPERTL